MFCLQLAYMKTCWNILFNLLYFWYRDVSVEAKSPSLKMFVHHREMISGQARKNPSQRQQKSTRLKTGTKVDCVSFNKTNHLYKIPYIRVFHGSTHLQKLEKIFNFSCVIFSRLKYTILENIFSYCVVCYVFCSPKIMVKIAKIEQWINMKITGYTVSHTSMHALFLWTSWKLTM